MLKRAARWTAAAAAAVVAFALIANAFDEDLDPEVLAVLEARPAPVASSRNGYFYLVGIGMSGEDPHAAGRRYVAAVDAAQQKRIAGEDVQWPRIERLKIAFSDLCAMDGAPCLEKVGADKAGAHKLLDEHALLVERYRTLLEYPQYQETQRLSHYETPLPDYFGLGAAQRLFHIQAALRLGEGKALQVAYDLERALRLSRRMLAGSSTVLGKMLAAAHGRRAALFLSEALPAVARADRKALARLADALAPLSPVERDLAPAFASELAMAASAMRGCDTTESALTCYFFQPNATLNRLYFAAHKPFLELAQAPAHRFDALRTTPQESRFPWWGVLYNPWGKLMLAASSGRPPWDYVARVNDLDALFRVVALQALIGERDLKAAEVPGFLAGSVKRYADPYSGKAMGWDARRGQLWFEPRGTPALRNVGGVAKRFSVRL